jgi:hypothetical protein
VVFSRVKHQPLVSSTTEIVLNDEFGQGTHHTLDDRGRKTLGSNCTHHEVFIGCPHSK